MAGYFKIMEDISNYRVFNTIRQFKITENSNSADTTKEGIRK